MAHVPKVVSAGSAFDRLASSTGGAQGRVGVFILLMVIALVVPGIYAWVLLSRKVEKTEDIVMPKEPYSGEKLAAAAPRPLARPEPTSPAPPKPTPTTLPAPAPAPRPEKQGPDWSFIRGRTGGPMVVVQAAKEPGASMRISSSSTPSIRKRHVPRGTILPAFLESKVVSDNLDSRVRAVLLEDYKLGDDVILPSGGFFIGDAESLGSRYQKRIAVRVTNFVYPDKEREVAIKGLLLNPDESAHLDADEIDHHTGKLIAGIVGLEALRAAAGAVGGYQGNQVAVSFGTGVGDTTQGVLTPSLQNLTQIVPTITVEPGKPVLVFVEESFDVPELDALPEGFAVPAASDGRDDGATQADLASTMERLKRLMSSAEEAQATMSRGLMPGQALPQSAGEGSR
ncbi:MAG: TrbI/VirB10 family protein [Acidobacteriota bacterium]